MRRFIVVWEEQKSDADCEHQLKQREFEEGIEGWGIEAKAFPLRQIRRA